MANTFDFIVVGGGTAGCLLASRLSNSPAYPTVLLLEAGGEGLPIENRIPYKRFENAFTLPDFDHGYTTVPQGSLGGRELSYQRGKGLGGSSAINFLVYTRGPSADWDRWGEIVGDDQWGWEETKERFKRIETFENGVSEEDRRYADPKQQDHGYNGGLAISAPPLENDIRLSLQAGLDLGSPINLDHNSGDIIGVSATQLSYAKGVRSTSEQAFLQVQPKNLTIWTRSKVAKIVFRNKVAVGVEELSGKQAFATKEVILTAGAIDSAKLLLLSGVGPTKELEEVGVPVIHDLPGVGKNAKDHLQVMMVSLMKRSFSGHFELALDKEKNAAALEEWTKSRTGLYTSFFGSSGMIFGKTESTYETEAFKALDADTQDFLRKPGVPNWEIVFEGPIVPPTSGLDVEHSFANNFTVQLNSAALGEVKLRSKNPADKPLIDPKFLSNQYDREIFIAAVRAEIQLMKTETMRKHYVEPILGPKSDSDEDILAYIEATAGPLWHISSTTKMGKSTDRSAVVDSHLKVFGLKNLRVADVGVAPFSPNSHTQATAYLIGQAAADFIIEEHKLDLQN